MAHEREPWVIPSDIPEEDVERLTVYGTGGRQWSTEDKVIIARAKAISLRMARQLADDARRANQRALEMLRSTADAMGIDLDAEPPADDYEALGYPETGVRTARNLDIYAIDVAVTLDTVTLEWTRVVRDNEYHPTSITG